MIRRLKGDLVDIRKVVVEGLGVGLKRRVGIGNSKPLVS
jgi:hypothetical protein